jgi:glycosyltransferase involved in cell wall biosynthesis
VAEQVERLARDYEIHVYSNRATGVDLSRIFWHRVPALPGPHLIAYCWWFLANHLWRWWDRRFRGLHFDLTYTPGINCLDADVISVHIVFSEFFRQVRGELRLRQSPLPSWPRLIHRLLYYKLIMGLEPVVYSRKGILLTSVSRKTAADLTRFGRFQTPIIYHGLNQERFNSENRRRLRDQSRGVLGLSGSTFCLLFVGNDWKKKGLVTLLEAVGSIRPAPVRLLVVGRDDPTPFQSVIHRNGIESCVVFLPSRSDVEFYYSAADAYVSPALEEAFGLPPLEAMACGLPAIVSRQAGVSEVITHGVDGLILEDPRDAGALGSMIGSLYEDPALRQRLGENGARTALQYTWDRNVAELEALFDQVIAKRISQRLFGTR